MSARVRAAAVVAGAAAVVAAPFVVVHEGLVLRSYRDPVGIWSACYGHTGPDVRPGQEYNHDRCLQLLDEDLAIAAAAVRRSVRVELPDKTEAALISFTFNVGASNFRSSTLLSKLNAGDIAGACDELPRWVYARGRKLPGLVARREAERKLCLEGVSL